MRVYELILDGISGYVDDNIDHIQVELELSEEIDLEPFENSDIPTFIDDIEKMDIGTEKEFGCWTIKCREMSERDYNNLDEFDGW